ncbi:hypothetical protein D8B26_004495 [Coccidioides posadasii str. Silveira]|uniref:Uncharacterized protein n=3 Tax=Coccidioides posadasii TaxID=199306 RepID=E9DEV9_COCPS|nr:hypothetical protein CPC735_022160 [Coccidioides posadasii C735 delta SOWgp]EER22917.1 hypothetical protein CPC735_022160 [Coccidioides posadasii C735 delta SOWgp]EFW15171.1 conserved hypothetical protein [Coccidioides posadasii str. Silveira]KMM68981.1 hypothetical protein CPAG_05304 [Coccidioides posadasii RMSCC 3488]QVM09835.1 hypothetical protein D8B26_004495 [Coccidioides posadasii str. Silveira]|eukprot:XP_003065062.1 hypothetical protein CPC735_022160 [Coccidioides posadasii C735 delta SOWgp]
MPRLIRRRPFLERLKAYLNPLDFLLWLSEEFDSNDWAQWEREWAIPLGVGINCLFLLARANSRSRSQAYDDVFGENGGISWLNWLASFIVHLLALLSVLNAVYTFNRKRTYRLFEASIDNTPATPSAQRVKVASSPRSSSPLRLISNVLSSGSAESRSHPRPERDVWQIGVWDPHPLAIRLFCLFSPGHVLVYWLFLPTAPSDPRPSMTIVTTIFLATLFTVQLSTLSSSFTQQSKDSMLIHKEVLNEYDIKYVHPRTQPLMRDVATQFNTADSYQPHKDEKYNKVETYTPTVMRHGFKTNPNPNYLQHIDPESKGVQGTPRRQLFSTPRTSFSGSTKASSVQTPKYGIDSSPLISQSALRQPHFRPTPSMGDGGSLGVYSHAQSPLKRNIPTNLDQRSTHRRGDYESRDHAQSPARLPSSPLKRSSVPGGISASAAAQRWGHLATPSGRRESGRV